MIMKKTSDSIRNNPGLASLLQVCDGLTFEPHDIAQQLDERGHYNVEMDHEFPFVIKLFHYTSQQHTRGMTWHERMELFLPLDGPARLKMGEKVVELNQGDLLVVDNLKLHCVQDFPRFNTRVVVISFLPEFVYSLGSPSHDYAFLLPFYFKLDKQVHAVRSSDGVSSEVCRTVARLLECYFAKKDRHFYQAGCKAFFMEILYHMAIHFKSSEILKWEFVRQQQRSLRLKKLFDHISQHFEDKLTIPDAASMVGMSEPQFMKVFKKVSGMTLVSYLNHVRLSQAACFLKQTDWSIAEVANRVGFADQSYFDKRFKRSFGHSPKAYRATMAQATGSGGED
jgi:AraC-like DNA-binding protein